ncbi:MAG TPA: hypothetical protein VFC02_02210 [Anaerolineales bacterium]|nr:hypothetical protein [Anaerolineales bacterium]
MDTQKLESLPPPPGVMGSLRAGFDAVAGHVWLITVPLALDVVLWLGPRLSVDGLLRPFVRYVFLQARRGVAASEMDQFLKAQTIFLDGLQSFNLFSLVSKFRTFPIGISSLLAQTMPAVGTPFGEQSVVQISSLPLLVGLVFVLTAMGWMGGGLYFRWVSGTTLGEEETGISSLRAIIQTLILSVCWFIGLMMVLLPLMFVLTLLALINPILANGAIFLILLLAFWLVVPLFFMPHGIFARRQNAFLSALTSLRMARFTFPTSGMFILSVVILSQGMNYLWSVPSNDSWMTLVGIAGHAFITTAVLAASFVYYRDMNVWLQTVFEQWQKARTAPKQHA